MNKQQRETLKKSVKKFMAEKRKRNQEYPEEAYERCIEHEHNRAKKQRIRKRRRAKKVKKEQERLARKAERERLALQAKLKKKEAEPGV